MQRAHKHTHIHLPHSKTGHIAQGKSVQQVVTVNIREDAPKRKRKSRPRARKKPKGPSLSDRLKAAAEDYQLAKSSSRAPIPAQYATIPPDHLQASKPDEIEALITWLQTAAAAIRALQPIVNAHPAVPYNPWSPYNPYYPSWNNNFGPNQPPPGTTPPPGQTPPATVPPTVPPAAGPTMNTDGTATVIAAADAPGHAPRNDPALAAAANALSTPVTVLPVMEIIQQEQMDMGIHDHSTIPQALNEAAAVRDDVVNKLVRDHQTTPVTGAQAEAAIDEVIDKTAAVYNKYSKTPMSASDIITRKKINWQAYVRAISREPAYAPAATPVKPTNLFPPDSTPTSTPVQPTAPLPAATMKKKDLEAAIGQVLSTGLTIATKDRSDLVSEAVLAANQALIQKQYHNDDDDIPYKDAQEVYSAARDKLMQHHNVPSNRSPYADQQFALKWPTLDTPPASSQPSTARPATIPSPGTPSYPWTSILKIDQHVKDMQTQEDADSVWNELSEWSMEYPNAHADFPGASDQYNKTYDAFEAKQKEIDDRDHEALQREANNNTSSANRLSELMVIRFKIPHARSREELLAIGEEMKAWNEKYPTELAENPNAMKDFTTTNGLWKAKLATMDTPTSTPVVATPVKTENELQDILKHVGPWRTQPMQGNPQESVISMIDTSPDAASAMRAAHELRNWHFPVNSPPEWSVRNQEAIERATKIANSYDIMSAMHVGPNAEIDKATTMTFGDGVLNLTKEEKEKRKEEFAAALRWSTGQKPTLTQLSPEQVSRANLAEAAKLYYRTNSPGEVQSYLSRKGMHDWKFDPDLSTPEGIVVTNPQGQAEIAWRGTEANNINDLYTDVQMAAGNTDTEQFENAGKLVDAAVGKYGQVHHVTGFSLGGSKALELGSKRNIPTTAFNPYIGYKQNLNPDVRQHIITTTSDPVSLNLSLTASKNANVTHDTLYPSKANRVPGQFIGPHKLSNFTGLDVPHDENQDLIYNRAIKADTLNTQKGFVKTLTHESIKAIREGKTFTQFVSESNDPTDSIEGHSLADAQAAVKRAVDTLPIRENEADVKELATNLGHGELFPGGQIPDRVSDAQISLAVKKAYKWAADVDGGFSMAELQRAEDAAKINKTPGEASTLQSHWTRAWKDAGGRFSRAEATRLMGEQGVSQGIPLRDAQQAVWKAVDSLPIHATAKRMAGGAGHNELGFNSDRVRPDSVSAGVQRAIEHAQEHYGYSLPSDAINKAKGIAQSAVDASQVAHTDHGRLFGAIDDAHAGDTDMTPQERHAFAQLDDAGREASIAQHREGGSAYEEVQKLAEKQGMGVQPLTSEMTAAERVTHGASGVNLLKGAFAMAAASSAVNAFDPAKRDSAGNIMYDSNGEEIHDYPEWMRLGAVGGLAGVAQGPRGIAGGALGMVAQHYVDQGLESGAEKLGVNKDVAWGIGNLGGSVAGGAAQGFAVGGVAGAAEGAYQGLVIGAATDAGHYVGEGVNALVRKTGGNSADAQVWQDAADDATAAGLAAGGIFGAQFAPVGAALGWEYGAIKGLANHWGDVKHAFSEIF
jgi:hypothetical protein